jgi:hypothetical protein
MDIQFTDLSEVPLPPAEVRIRSLEVEPYPDGKRLRLTLELTPFQRPPSGEIFVSDLLGNQVAMASIIEAVDAKMQLTLHLRVADPQGEHTARLIIFYSEDIDTVTKGDQIVAMPARKIVDEKQITFELGD